MENINILYLFICYILKENKHYIMANSKETLMKEFNEISDFVKMDNIVSDIIKLYKSIPFSFLPIDFDYNEDILNELKNNEFFKNRWWEFENYNVDKYIVPIIHMDDILKYYDRILFVDIRTQQEYELQRVKDSLYLNSVGKNKYYDNTIQQLEKVNGSKIITLIGKNNTDYSASIQHLLQRKIKFISILQGGIDIVQLDEPNLIFKK
jgi:hypothetical protein